MASYWPTLGQYVEALERAGKLVRVTVPINKDTELHPLVRLQFRGLPESQRKAFLFENVVDARGRRYDIPVLVGALAGSKEIYALGMQCKLEEIETVWNNALTNQIAPVLVGKGACQEVVITGDALKRDGGGLGRLPIPISTPGFDNAPYTTAGASAAHCGCRLRSSSARRRTSLTRRSPASPTTCANTMSPGG